MKVLLVALGGSLGALCRYGANHIAGRIFGDGFPWGTLSVNLAGCFLIGFLFSVGGGKGFLSPSARLLLVTGFLGAFTTFSAFALETVHAGRSGLPMHMLANILANNVGGLVLVVAGMWVGRSV